MMIGAPKDATWNGPAPADSVGPSIVTAHHANSWLTRYIRATPSSAGPSRANSRTNAPPTRWRQSRRWPVGAGDSPPGVVASGVVAGIASYECERSSAGAYPARNATMATPSSNSSPAAVALQLRGSIPSSGSHSGRNHPRRAQANSAPPRKRPQRKPGTMSVTCTIRTPALLADAQSVRRAVRGSERYRWSKRASSVPACHATPTKQSSPAARASQVRCEG